MRRPELACASRWSKLLLHTKARLGWHKFRPGIVSPISQYSHIGRRKSGRKKIQLTSTGTRVVQRTTKA